MVALLTSISTARDAGTLVSIVLHGLVTLGMPDCSSCHFWVCALDKTFSATPDGEVEEQEGMYSEFMRALYHDPDLSHLKVPCADFRVLGSTPGKYASPTSVTRLDGEGVEGEEEDDEDHSVLLLGAFDSQRNMLGIVELRNSPMMVSYCTAHFRPVQRQSARTG
jgi:hypothetical protein